MTQIKSEKAKKYAESAAFSPGGISYTLTYGDAYDGFIAGYEAAETEAEERHAKELHELRDRAADSYKAVCRTLFFGCDLESCDPSKCSGLLSFTQKLNER